MKYLVDVNVLSEGTKSRAMPSVIEWLRKHESDLVINPIIRGELELGILLLPAGRRRAALSKWFEETIQPMYVVAIDGATASIWSRLVAELQRKGKTMPIKDSLIAASARQHGLTVVTRNVADYRYASTSVVNPFDAKGRNAR